MKKLPKDTQPRLEVLNVDELMDRLEGDRLLLSLLARLFCTSAPQKLADLRKAVEARDEREISRAAHYLRGSAGDLSGWAVYDTAGAVEERARRGCLVEVAEALPRLEREVWRLMAALGEFCSQGCEAAEEKLVTGKAVGKGRAPYE